MSNTKALSDVQDAVPDVDPSVKTCFVICAVSTPGSEIRWNADRLMDLILKPVLESDGLGYKVIRVDQELFIGSITSRIVDHLIKDELAVVDLSFPNINVGYELGIRHAFQKPTIIMTNSTLRGGGSDFQHNLHISYNHLDGHLQESAKKSLRELENSITTKQYIDFCNPVIEAANPRSEILDETRRLTTELGTKLDLIVNALGAEPNQRGDADPDNGEMNTLPNDPDHPSSGPNASDHIVSDQQLIPIDNLPRDSSTTTIPTVSTSQRPSSANATGAPIGTGAFGDALSTLQTRSFTDLFSDINRNLSDALAVTTYYHQPAIDVARIFKPDTNFFGNMNEDLSRALVGGPFQRTKLRDEALEDKRKQDEDHHTEGSQPHAGEEETFLPDDDSTSDDTDSREETTPTQPETDC